MELLTEALAEMEAAQVEHDAVYARWAELTEKARSAADAVLRRRAAAAPFFEGDAFWVGQHTT